MAARAVHHAGSAERIGALFREIFGALASGGVFINLDFVRYSSPAFHQLGVWADSDPDAGYSISSPHMELPASLDEQLAGLRAAGFAEVECVYREFQTVIVVATRNELRVPQGEEPA